MPISFPNEKELIEAINNREVCLLLGAGFTYGLRNIAGGKFKSAGELAGKIQKDLFPTWSESDQKNFNSLDKIISESIKQNKKEQLSELLKSELSIREEDLDIDYKLLAVPNWCRVYTLNVDNTLELIFRNNTLPLTQYKFPQSLEFHDRSNFHETQAIYLHGKLPCDIENELVFSFESYVKENVHKKNDLYSFFIKDFFTKPFIIIGVSFEDDDFYNYALVEKDKHNINFQNSKFSYLIDIYESEQKDNKFKRDFNIHHLPKTSTHDFLDWIKLKSSHFGKQTDFDTAFKSRYQRLTLRNFLSFDLSFIRQEYVEQSDLFGKLCFDVLRSYQNDNFPLRKEFSLFSIPSNEFEGFKIVAENKVNSEERILINCCRVESIANGISIETEFFRILQIELPEEFRSNKSQWFSEKKPSRVVFCLASDHIDPQAKEFYQLQVKQYFLAMSVTSGLEYLVGIELVFLYWEELKRVIENDIYLYHKWIGREPQYVRVLSEEDKQKGAEGIANEFRDYLQDRFLPYFSRNSFKPKLSKTEQQDFYTESKFINLLKTSNCNGIILYGQGGSGKTRLMYELGYRMMAERYSVIDVNKNFNDVNVFNDFLGQKGMYILLFDYVEEQRSFFKIVEWIYNNKIRNVRFIANCRKSYLGDVEHTSRYKTILIDVGIKRVAEKKYKDAIVYHIIKGISDETLRRKLNENSDILSFLLERPSFAVFIKYLYQKNPSSSFDLKNENDFNNWVLVRLKLTLEYSGLNNKEFVRDKNYIFKVFSSLRAYYESAEKLKKDYLSDISALIDDGWIDEDENGVLNVVHDTITDTLLLYFFNKTLNETLINDFLEFSVKYDSLTSVLRSFDRLFDDDVFREAKKEKIQFQVKAFIEKQFDKDLEPETALTLVRYWLKKGDKPEVVKPFIVETLNQLSDRQKAASVIIGYWLASSDDPVLVKFHIEKCLGANINPKTACYIIGYWLEKGDDPLLIKNYLLQYVNDKTDPGSFSYILQSWLKNGDDPNYLNSLVINWLKIETNQLTKGYVIKNFIEFGGDLKIIQVQANDWLKDNKESSLSISIIGFWLNRLSEQENNSETLDILKEHVLNVLNKFSSISTTGSVISNWIVKGGDLKLLRPHLNIWLSKYINSTHAEFVISWWMMKGGFPKDVKEFIIPWLSIFGTSKAASELMFSWLNNGYDPSIIENYVQPYLELYSEKFESKYLINACLKAGLSPTLVKDSILPWLNSNGFKTESIYLAANWLSQGKDFTLVEKFIKEKLDKYIESEVDCNLILENWLTSGGDPVIIKSHVNLYLEKYWRHKNAIYLIRRWINATNDSNFVEPYIHRILKFRKKNKRRNNPFVKESFRYLRLIPILKLLQNLKFKFIYHFSEVLQRRITYKIERHLQEGLNPDLIKKEVNKYFQVYRGRVESSIVLRKWLEYANDFNFVKDYLSELLEYNKNEKITGSFLIGDSMLSCLEGFNLAKPYALKWLQIYGDSEEAFFVVSSYCRAIEKLKLNPECISEVKEFIIPCLKRNYKYISPNDSWKWRQNILLKHSDDWEP